MTTDHNDDSANSDNLTLDNLIEYQRQLCENYQINPVVTLIAKEILASLRELKRRREASEQMPEQTAKQQYDAHGGDSESDPVERLRFFCSLAMCSQDWLDAEPFFDAINKLRAAKKKGGNDDQTN